MRLNIIIPYRPLSGGHLTSPKGPLVQTDTNCWRSPSGKTAQHPRDDLERALFFLRKNSAFPHRIWIILDADVYPLPGWLTDVKDVNVIYSFYQEPEKENNPYSRLACAYRDAITHIADEELICYGYTADLICAKQWDWYIQRAMWHYGPDHVYVPMFVEMKDGQGYTYGNIKGVNPTSDLIWNVYRQHICCHGLTWP